MSASSSVSRAGTRRFARTGVPTATPALLGLLLVLHYANGLLFLGILPWQVATWLLRDAPRGSLPMPLLLAGAALFGLGVINLLVAEGLRRRSVRAARAAVLLWAVAVIGSFFDAGLSSSLFASVLVLGGVIVQWRRFET